MLLFKDVLRMLPCMDAALTLMEAMGALLDGGVVCSARRGWNRSCGAASRRSTAPRASTLHTGSASPHPPPSRSMMIGSLRAVCPAVALVRRLRLLPWQ